jgi:uncharacterized protein (DUF433 family)
VGHFFTAFVIAFSTSASVAMILGTLLNPRSLWTRRRQLAFHCTRAMRAALLFGRGSRLYQADRLHEAIRALQNAITLAGVRRDRILASVHSSTRLCSVTLLAQAAAPRGFGQPIIAGTRIQVRIANERYHAGESLAELAQHYHPDPEQTKEAIRCEASEATVTTIRSVHVLTAAASFCRIRETSSNNLTPY